MTDAQIEQIARAYCRKLGLDPEKISRLAFAGMTDDVREAIAMREAIDQVLGEKGAGHATTV